METYRMIGYFHGVHWLRCFIDFIITMCGILALFGSQVSKNTRTNAFEKIKYRGPDCSRLEQLPNYPYCYIGFHRLAILDPAHGMQPMRLVKYRHLWLICNGEIYNHKELSTEFSFDCQTQSDVEVIVYLYLKGGITFAVKQLDGTFAFCLVDTAKGKIYIGRDTFGVQPVFRLHNENGFLGICSEGKGLIGLSDGKFPETIDQLVPGHVETYNLDAYGSTSFEKRTCVNRIGQVPVYMSCILDEFDEKRIGVNIRTLLEAAVTKRMAAERRIGCLLSGGLDSSIVASLVCKVANKLRIQYKIQTFSIGFEGSKDLQAAKKVADFLKTEHHEIICTPEDGIAAIPDIIYHLESYDMCNIRASIGMYLLCKYIRENTDTVVIMSGEGADEIAQGYSKFHKAPSASFADKESRRLCENLYMFDVLRADRMVAASGLEIRLPFLDHCFSSYYLSLPKELRNPRNGVEKYTLRLAFDDVNILPPGILWRPKECFADGVSSNSVSLCRTTAEFTDKQFGNTEFQHEVLKFKTNSPPTKEALYYRLIFEEMYKDHWNWLPYFWDSK